MTCFCVLCKRYSGNNPKGVWYWCCFNCNVYELTDEQSELIKSTLGKPIPIIEDELRC